MNKKGSGTAWAIAALAVVALIGSLLWGFAQHKQVRLLQQNAASSRPQAQAPKKQPGQQDPQVRQLEETVAQLEQRLAAAASQPAPAAVPEDAAAPDAGPAKQADLKTFEGEEGKKLAEASADAMMTTYYEDLFTELALPPEVEQKVRGIIRDFSVRLLHGSAQVMKDGTADEVEKFENRLRAELKTSLSRFLTNEGMAIYDEYMRTLPERVLRKNYQRQIGIHAPSLSEEDRTMVVDVLVEEMLAAREEVAGENRGASAIEALERSRQRLSTVLDEQQMSQVDSMLEQQRRVYERFQK